MLRLLLFLSVFIFVVSCKHEKEYELLPDRSRTLRLLFAGDAMMHVTQLGKARKDDGYCFDSYFPLIKPLTDSVDIAVVNLETTLAASKYTGYPLFASPDSYAKSLKDAGFNVFLTANNHCLDRGKTGLERTIHVLDSMQVRRAGTYKDEQDKALEYPLLIYKNGIRIAMLNYTYGMNGLVVKTPNLVNVIDTAVMKRDIERCRQLDAHFIITTIHWGDEYVIQPNREQQALKKFLTSQGVDLIVGSHPHVIQPLVKEVEDGKIKHAVAYSLGNFVSNMDRTLTDGGMLLTVDIRRDSSAVKAVINSVAYSLVYVHKSFRYASGYQLIPVEQYLSEQQSLPTLDKYSHQRMLSFQQQANEAIQRKVK